MSATLSLTELMDQRISANAFDSSKSLSKEAIQSLLDVARKAPSAFNAQNWKVLAVVSPEAKQALHAKAFGQQKVLDAAVTFIVCGTTNLTDTINSALQPSLDAGIINEETFNGWVGAVQGMYGDNPAMQRDEAIRSGSLLAMSLMLAAQEQGLASCPMIGFDAAGVADTFELDANTIPVMLVTVGYEAAGNWPQKPRRSVSEFCELL